MAKHGTALGADLYELWDAGTHLLPTAAEQFRSAWASTPGTVAGTCLRSGALGISDTGPAPALDAVLDLLDRATSETERNLRAVGDALVRVAGEYARTDEAAAAEFRRKQESLGDVG